jgi:hypothetical protein
MEFGSYGRNRSTRLSAEQPANGPDVVAWRRRFPVGILLLQAYARRRADNVWWRKVVKWRGGDSTLDRNLFLVGVPGHDRISRQCDAQHRQTIPWPRTWMFTNLLALQCRGSAYAG